MKRASKDFLEGIHEMHPKVLEAQILFAKQYGAPTFFTPAAGEK